MLLSEEQILIRDTARAFAQERVLPHVRAWEAAGEIPRSLLAEMGRLGFMGMCVPTEWGGAGAGMLSYVLALEEIAAADGGLSTVMSVNNSPDCAALMAYGSTEQKEKWLKPLASGEMLGAFCLTEPQAGSDASNLKTRAERRGNGWVLNGVKQFITSGRTADMALVFAVTDPANTKRGISCFIVPTRTPGYRVASVEKKLGQKSSDTCQIAFENCEVGADAMLGSGGQGYRIALANLEVGRIGIAAQAVGMARASFELARAYAGEREAFGTKIVNHQAVQFRLADMATKTAVARQMVLHAASLREAGQPCLTEAAMAKLYASEMAEEVCSAAIQIHGGYGYVSDYLAEKIWRDVRVCQIYEGTSDVQRILIGRGLAVI
ncbi:MAG: acyl-CoA dehydrogenase family protein [Alphaproteobacteria bacterium]|nr:acyl-CoA dehydrogenase family protein [Alphaproteobacteria bacterium]